jgi:DNA primase
VARIRDHALRDEYARQLAGWVGWEDVGSVLRRVRETSGAPVMTRDRRRPTADGATGEATGKGPVLPPRRDPRLDAQRNVLKAALQLPALAGPVYDALPEEAFGHPAYRALHAAVRAAGGTAAGLSGPEWIEAVRAHCIQPTLVTLLSELSVETLPTRDETDVRYVHGVLAGLQAELVGRQVADLKSRLQRLSPSEDADEFHHLFGDLVALEQYHKALREQAMGALG